MRLLTLTATALLSAPVYAAKSVPGSKARNFIYVVPDGYGAASQVLARDYYSLMDNVGTVERPSTAQIGVDSLVIGTVRTQASDNLVTDSAASATAFACGIKTYNGAIGVDDDGMPVGSILEAAHLDGFKTALVVTSRITHATPGGYSAHVLSRNSENEIAAQQIGYTHPFGPFVDLLMGGGWRHYLPADKGGKREDGVNLFEWAEEQGYTCAQDKSDMDASLEGGKLPLPFLGLFASSHLDYEIDRKPEEQPSLLDMAKVALETLEETTKSSRKGYFIMIEASRVDHAAHANDAASHVHDTLMYNEVMAYLKEFVTKNPDTQLMSAADHECGGLTLEDNYNPTVLAKAQHSTEHLGKLLEAYKGDDMAGYLRQELLPLVGVDDVTDADIERFLSIYEQKKDVYPMGIAIGGLFAKEAGLNWATDGHTAVDVLLHGFAAGEGMDYMRRLMGTNVNNIELPVYIEKVLDLKMSDATKVLRKDGVDWVEKRDELHIVKREANAAAQAHKHTH